MSAEVRSLASAGEGKIIITGTGRAGTTLLVRLLTGMGLDTREDQLKFYDKVNAGLEITDPARPGTPRVIKSPELSVHLPRMLAEGHIKPEAIDHVLLPIRDLDAAAASRVMASVKAGVPKKPGGMWGTTKPHQQKWFLAEAFYGLLESLTYHEVPITTLAFPRFAEDCDYAYRKLSFLAPAVSADDFAEVWSGLVDQTLIHQVGPEQWSRRNRLRLQATTFKRRVEVRWLRWTGRSTERKR
jgi:hypothetical protein